MTVGLATLNATAPLFKLELRHLNAWLKKGTLACYMLMDDIRELWNREGFLVEVGRGRPALESFNLRQRGFPLVTPVDREREERDEDTGQDACSTPFIGTKPGQKTAGNCPGRCAICQFAHINTHVAPSVRELAQLEIACFLN